MAASFLFYDLETFGSDPRRTRIAQFAAVRTDSDLNVIEEPISFFVQPADDLLPSPIATLITGITPQHALREGVNEAEAFARIAEEMARPETCTLGWNSLRFDDEFVRHGLFRNFHDPYEREWRGGNSRWDMLDVMRLAHALRPQGIEWPQREDGKGTSFKLEHLALANGVREGDAHEALSDVYATLGMARKFRDAQPRLWDYALKLRDKKFAATLLDTIALTPALHVSQRYPANRLCAAPVLPLARHPRFDNRVIVFDLDGDPEALLQLDAADIADRFVHARRGSSAWREARAVERSASQPFASAGGLVAFARRGFRATADRQGGRGSGSRPATPPRHATRREDAPGIRQRACARQTRCRCFAVRRLHRRWRQAPPCGSAGHAARAPGQARVRLQGSPPAGVAVPLSRTQLARHLDATGTAAMGCLSKAAVERGWWAFGDDIRELLHKK